MLDAEGAEFRADEISGDSLFSDERSRTSGTSRARSMP